MYMHSKINTFDLNFSSIINELVTFIAVVTEAFIAFEIIRFPLIDLEA